MSRLPPRPALVWGEDGAPRAEIFDDVYFSRAGGLEESRAVFLEGCALPARWQGQASHRLCELGFGAGLNALATWALWARTRAPGARLDYVAIEAFPLVRAEAARALAQFSPLGGYADRLLARWPVRAYGPQRLWFPEDGFALTLIVGEVSGALDGLTGQFESWFLDGFAPARNPAMWSEAVARRIAALSAPGAHAASYSVAGAVRRALAAAGFAVEKRPGFAAKRERLEARLSAPPPQPQALYPYAGARPTTAAVIGAGIAGAAMAHALAQRGCAVAVYEAGPAPAAGASGNPAGLVMPRLDRGQGPVQALYLGAFVHAVAAYGAALDRCGVIERDRPDLIADPPLPEDWLTPENESDIVHRHAGLVRPAPLIEAWLQGADLRCSQSVARLAHENGHWRLFNADGARLGQADAVVLANGAALNRFAQTAWLDLRLTAGQIECGACADPPARVLLGESYAAPFQGGLLFGATFDRVAVAEARPAPDARARNLAALEALAPALAARLDRRTLSSRAGVRAAAPDYAPIAGLAPDAPVWLARQAGLAHGRPPDLSAPAPAHANLYVLGGLGARGLTLAPILAERIAAEMFGEPQILLRDALAAAHPARFLHRTLKRGLTKPNLGETSDDDLD